VVCGVPHACSGSKVSLLLREALFEALCRPAALQAYLPRLGKPESETS
jgi:hypothetical protein